MRPSRLKQIGDDVIDAGDFLANVLDYISSRARRRKIAADNFNDSGDSREWIPDFMGQSCCDLAQRGEVFGARHLRSMQALDFFAVLAQLFDHLVEVASKIADLVVAMGKTDGYGEVVSAQFRDLLLQFHHGP